MGKRGPARTIARLCALFIAYCEERAWKGIRDRLPGHYYLSRVHHVPRIKGRKQITDIGDYSFVNRPLKTENNYL